MAAQGRPQSDQEVVQHVKPSPAQLSELLDQVISESEQSRKEKIILQNAELNHKQRLAKAFAESGCFADMKDKNGTPLPKEQAIGIALVKIELGEAMGFTAAESMTGIDIIKGRMAIGASLRAARMQRAGFSWKFLQLDNAGCSLAGYFKGRPLLDERNNPAVVSFTEVDAKMQGLLGKEGSNYTRCPSDMYFARCITRFQRRYGPGVLGLDIPDTYEAMALPAEGTMTQMPKRKSEAQAETKAIAEVVAKAAPGEPTEEEMSAGLAAQLAKEAE